MLDMHLVLRLQTKAFNGLALLIVRSEHGKAGRVKITATGEGLRAGETTVTTK